MLSTSDALHMYSHVPQQTSTAQATLVSGLHHDPTPTDTDVHDTRSSSTCTSTLCCGSAFGGTFFLYVSCALFDVITLLLKQVIFFWLALFICMLLCVSCTRCATSAVSLQVVVGIFMYVYWFNFFGIWNHCKHYHHSHSWPWYPSL